MTKGLSFSNRLEFLGFRLVTATIGSLPMGGATGFNAWAGRTLGMRVDLRRRAEKNLAYAMPELSAAERKGILTEMFDGFARTVTEFRYLPRLIAEPDRISVEGAEHLQAAQAAGKGAVLFTGHYGNWEVTRIASARLGWPPALIYRAFNNPIFDAHAQSQMGVIDAPLFHKGRKGSLGLVRHIKQGGCGLILTDQKFSRAPLVPFFGKPAQTSLGSAEIAVTYGAALLPIRGERLGRDSRFRVIIEPPLETEGRSALELTAEINTRLEGWIRARPEQYFWMHNRWGKAALREAPPLDQ